MATEDFSRSAFDAAKQYTSVRMQQGRVLLDQDWNDNELLASEALRRTRLDLVGAAGSPDAGFQIINPHVAGDQVDFDIDAGVFYLGGLRLELGQAQTLRNQADQLQAPAAGAAPKGERTDLVMLLAYEQPVTAVEDSELFEVALGGPDTTARIRTMQRVLLWENVDGAGCEDAWQIVQAKLQDAGLGVLNDEHELITDATLTVTFTEFGVPDDLCTPAVAGGYLGAENQAIRIQLVDSSHLTWGFNNAAPLYRVQVAADRRTVTLLTDPKDQAHWPLAGQVVELLPWAAVLPNNEKVAEQSGRLTRVTASYNPDTGELTVADALPTSGFDDWQARDDAAQLAAAGEYYFLRVWDRGSDQVSAPAIPFTPGTALTLGATGLQETLNGSSFRPRDYWVIAARPETPTRVVPWELEQGRPPHGLRLFAAPLALIRWPGDPATEARVDDCRPRFRPLIDQAICCTYTVGDGKRSHGDFDSIEAALARLPATGGRLCLLPGIHEANVTIRQRANLTITGCGNATRVIPRPGQRQAPIFHIVGAQDVTLEHLDLVALEGAAIVAAGSDKTASLRGLTIQHNRILAYRNAIHVLQGDGVIVANNVLRMVDKDGGDVAIYLLAENAAIERNDIGVVPPEVAPPPPDKTDDNEEDAPNPTDPCADPEAFYANQPYFLVYLTYIWAVLLVNFVPQNPFKALGGIQIGSGAHRVRIAGNQIAGGAGNGVTLGSDLDFDDLVAGDQETGAGDADFVVEPGNNLLWGRVMDGLEPVAGATLVFKGAKETVTVVTDGDGQFLDKAQDGAYSLALTDAAYRLAGVSSTDQGEFGRFYEIRVARQVAEADLLHVLDTIDDISIDGNEITNMGLSGIGHPLIDLDQVIKLLGKAEVKRLNKALVQSLGLQLRLFGALTGFVTKLHIAQNQIHRCLRNAFVGDERNMPAQLRGVGGISLGLCTDLAIHNNRIEENGAAFLGPAHGIFVSYADQAEVSHNVIVRNGITAPDKRLQGQPGGVTFFFVAASNAPGAEEEPFARAGRQALRFHDNLVHQPVGRALTVLLGLGPIAVADNQLSTDSAATEARPNVRTSAGSRKYASVGLATNALVGAGLLLNLAINAGVVLVVNLGAPAALSQDRQTKATTRAAMSKLLRPGATLFNDNQVRLGTAQGSVVAQALFALDDISYANNQAAVSAGDVLSANALIFALLSLRATGNRLQEPQAKETTRFSMLSVALALNSTALNQGDHCIIAQGGKVFEAGNLVLFGAEEECRGFAKLLDPGFAQMAQTSYVSQPKGVRAFTRADTEFTATAANPVQALIFQFDALQSEALSGLRAVQLGGHALLQREESRLAQTLGAAHPRVQALRASKDALQESILGLRATAEQLQIRTPAISADEVLFHGRVLDAQQQGIAGLRVYLADAQGQIIKNIAGVTTDAGGYYALRTQAGSLPADVALTVATTGERVVLREQPSFDVTAGGVNRLEVELDRLRLAGVKTRRSQGAGSQETTEPWIVTGQVTNAAGKPQPGLMVSAFDRDVRYDDKLGAALTDAEGRYIIAYTTHDFREGAEPGPDLYLTVMDFKGDLLFTSEQEIRRNAGQREVFDIQLARRQG